jgi:ribosomal protein L3 glutamine methyltransferase
MENNLDKLVTNLDYIQFGEKLFVKSSLYYGHGTSTPFDEAAYIVLTITDDITNTDESVYHKIVNPKDKIRIETCFKRRVEEKIPAAYILGEAWFFGLRFFVNEHVLVPRSPFAELIAEKFEPFLVNDNIKSILDLCTGSGCIGIACATVFSEALVDLADISVDALAVANENIQHHNLQTRVKTIESNLLRDIPAKQYDLIVSNPPYVGHEELDGLPEEFNKEPRLGLDGGEMGLDLVHQILFDASEYLTDDGILYIEVGNSDELLQASYPTVPFLWQEFEYGGHGVFMLTKGQLLEHKQTFLLNLPN